MSASARTVLVVLAGLIVLAAGYGASLVMYAGDRRGAPGVIDLDDLPTVKAPPTTVEPSTGADLVPPPTLGASTAPPAPTSPPPTTRDDDDGDDDNVDHDAGQPDDD